MHVFVHLEGKEAGQGGGMERGWSRWLAGMRGAVKANEKGKGAQMEEYRVEGHRGVESRGSRAAGGR